jgi:ubiquitin carboxyl-terminal hydrolase 5/13
MLSEMGFSHAQASKALRETVSSMLSIDGVYLIGPFQDGDVERAVEWLFNHPDDTGEDVPMGDVSGASTTKAKDLPGTGTLPAKYILKAFISHKGPSVHSGHYVVHIKHPDLVPGSSGRDADGEPEEGWILFNDEKIVKADKESVRDLKRLAYLYIFEKAQA